MNEYEQRQEAINRHLLGEKNSKIAHSFGKSRKWVHQWINRFKQKKDDPGWYKDESKAPKYIAVKTEAEIEQQILIVLILFTLILKSTVFGQDVINSKESSKLWYGRKNTR